MGRTHFSPKLPGTHGGRDCSAGRWWPKRCAPASHLSIVVATFIRCTAISSGRVHTPSPCDSKSSGCATGARSARDKWLLDSRAGRFSTCRRRSKSMRISPMFTSLADRYRRPTIPLSPISRGAHSCSVDRFSSTMDGSGSGSASTPSFQTTRSCTRAGWRSCPIVHPHGRHGRFIPTSTVTCAIAISFSWPASTTPCGFTDRRSPATGTGSRPGHTGLLVAAASCRPMSSVETATTSRRSRSRCSSGTDRRWMPPVRSRP